MLNLEPRSLFLAGRIALLAVSLMMAGTAAARTRTASNSIAERLRTSLLAKPWVQAKINRAIESAAYDFARRASNQHIFAVFPPEAKQCDAQTGLSCQVLLSWSRRAAPASGPVPAGLGISARAYQVTKARLGLRDIARATLGLPLNGLTFREIPGAGLGTP
jgi:hypothetical protein